MKNQSNALSVPGHARCMKQKKPIVSSMGTKRTLVGLTYDHLSQLYFACVLNLQCTIFSKSMIVHCFEDYKRLHYTFLERVHLGHKIESNSLTLEVFFFHFLPFPFVHGNSGFGCDANIFHLCFIFTKRHEHFPQKFPQITSPLYFVFLFALNLYEYMH